jgi:hypothetical protein
MPSTHFVCPHCKRLLQKSDPDYIAGEAGGFVSFGSRERTCPACGKSIDAMEIRKGTYDPQPSAGGKGVWVVVAIVIAVVILWAISR